MIKALILAAVIVILALIVLTAYLVTLNRRKQAARSEQLARRLELAQGQLNVATAELKTIRDTGGEHTLNATLALEEIDRLRETYYAGLETSK